MYYRYRNIFQKFGFFDLADPLFRLCLPSDFIHTFNGQFILSYCEKLEKKDFTQEEKVPEHLENDSGPENDTKLEGLNGDKTGEKNNNFLATTSQSIFGKIKIISQIKTLSFCLIVGLIALIICFKDKFKCKIFNNLI